MANKPVFTRRLNRIEVAIWNNETKDSIWQNITFQRTYRDEKGETQNAINNFRMDDLPALTFLAAKAYDCPLAPVRTVRSLLRHAANP